MNTRIIVRIILVVLCVIVLISAYTIIKNKRPSKHDTNPNAVKVLFIGNSYTTTHDVPNILHQIADAKHQPILLKTAAYDGAKLSGHLENNLTQAAIASEQWDFVVLQEQSQLQSFSPAETERQSSRHARMLIVRIHERNPNAKILLYQTWGYKNGDRMNCAEMPQNCGFDGMNYNIVTNYRQLAAQTHSMVVPVGEIWQRVRTNHPEIELYEGDGIHPSSAGAYLAASTFYASIYHQPVDGAPNVGIDSKIAGILQQEVDSYVNLSAATAPPAP